MGSVTVVAIVVLAAVVAMVVRIATRLLDDLANTGDDDLCYLTRRGWTIVIVAMFPLGAIMYLGFAKGPHRYV